MTDLLELLLMLFGLKNDEPEVEMKANPVVDPNG